MPVNQEKNGGEIVLMQLFQDLCKKRLNFADCWLNSLVISKIMPV